MARTAEFHAANFEDDFLVDLDDVKLAELALLNGTGGEEVREMLREEGYSKKEAQILVSTIKQGFRL